MSVVHYLNLSNSNFINNSAGNFGGAIYIRGGRNGVNITNCYFINNHVSETGGAIYSPSREENSFNIVDSYFINNSAGYLGGAIYSMDYINISNSKFIDNKAKVGGAICGRNYLTVTNSEFVDNSAYLGDNIAYNHSESKNTIEITEGLYKFINRVDNSLVSNLSDGYVIFIENVTDENLNHYKKRMYLYPNFEDDTIYSYSYLSTIYFIANNTEINDYFLPSYVYYYDLNLSDPYFGISQQQLSVYDLYTLFKNMIFNESRWNEMKIAKVKELLNDPTLNIANVPDQGFIKQINETTYALIDFEILQSVKPWTYGFDKNGVGTYSYWLPAYKITYKTINQLANFTVEKVALNKTVTIGENVSFDIIIKNTGLINLTDIFVVEDIPEGLQYLSHSDTNVWNKINNVFYYLNTLGVNETVKFTITFNTTRIGNWTNIIMAGSNQTDNKTSNDTVKVNETPTNVTNVTKNETPKNQTNVTENRTVTFEPDVPEGNNTEISTTYKDIDRPDNTPSHPGEYEDLRHDQGYGPGKDRNDSSVETSKNNDDTESEKPENQKQPSSDISVDKNATGNPIFLALLVLFVCLTSLRRRRD